MNFLVDAQLPLRLARRLRELGQDVKHTLELPLKNRTPDRDIVDLAVGEGRIVITKDSEFVQSFTLTGEPPLLLVSTGNIANRDLVDLLERELPSILRAFLDHRFIELRRDALYLHR